MARSQSDNIEIMSQPKRALSPPPSLTDPHPPNSNGPVSGGVTGREPEQREGSAAQDEPSSGVVSQPPCERCERTGKVCRGAPGSRCDYCKRLKQKCSNSNAPARGKHAAAAARLAAATGLASLSVAPRTNISSAIASSSTSAPVPVLIPQVTRVVRTPPSTSAAPPAQAMKRGGRKRKAEDSPLSSDHAAETADINDDYDDGGHQPPARFNKKRRTVASSALIATRVLKYVKDLEATVKRLENNYNREMEHVDSIISMLTKDMTELTDTSDRDASS